MTSRTAGTDLAEPRDDVTAAADSAVAAQEAVVEAEQELADAQAALAAAQSSGSAAASTPAVTISPTPLAPAATVSRVQEAESEFTAAQQGITDETPLVQASQQFNAAAVALEMAWLRLFADAGCLTDEQQAAGRGGRRRVHHGAADIACATPATTRGEVDGVYGPATVDAVEALQQAHGLPSTGTVDKATAAALQADLEAKGGVAAQQSVASTAAVQQTLKLAGFWDGPVDGEWTPALTEALRSSRPSSASSPPVPSTRPPSPRSRTRSPRPSLTRPRLPQARPPHPRLPRPPARSTGTARLGRGGPPCVLAKPVRGYLLFRAIEWSYAPA